MSGLAMVAAGVAAVGWIIAHHRWRRAERDLAEARSGLAAAEKRASGIRHDVRGILSPALLTADRLTAHADPSVRRAGEIMIKTVERTTERLARCRPRPDD